MGTIQFKEVNCRNCYKCIRNCPVKAISLIEDHAQVIEDGCILCGKCLSVCPQNAKSVNSEVEKVKSFLEKKQKVYASIAPSFHAAFGVMDNNSIGTVFGQLGFTHVEETAIGAAVVTEEYRKLMQQQMKNIISTACPTVVSLVEKHFPQLLSQLAPVVSPMIAHGKLLKELYGQRIKVVFIGPCLSKKEECMDSQNDKVIDAVITFDEFEEWMKLEDLSFQAETTMQKNHPMLIHSKARFYPAPGGIIKAVDGFKGFRYKPLKFDGTDRCMEILETLSEDQVSGYFIEMNSCAGGCLNGPCMNLHHPNFIETRERLLSYISHCNKVEGEAEGQNRAAGKRHEQQSHEDFSKTFVDKSLMLKTPDEGEIEKVLATIGKFSRVDELNCGACGYSTCREKAVAVINGKAESHMCLPYMRQRAESISNVIIQSTPNAIFALSENLEIQEANQAACRVFQLENEDYKGRKIYEIIECPDIYKVCEEKTDILNAKYCYENYELVVEQSILYIKENRMILLIMKDITRDEKKHAQLNKVKHETVDIAQKVIEKQMRVAQEIASLLGETTAETKVALTKLKNAIQSEIGDEL